MSPATTFPGIVHVNVAVVASAAGFVAHDRSARDSTPSRLKSIHPHSRAVRSTPDSETGMLYEVPMSDTPNDGKEDTPSSLVGIEDP